MFWSKMSEIKQDSNEEANQVITQTEDYESGVELIANVIEASKDGDVVKYTIQSKEVCVILVLINSIANFSF